MRGRDFGQRLRGAPALLLAASALLISPAAYAAKAATVASGNVDMRDGPNSTGSVVETLSRGAPVAASNAPVEGYYKVRASDGKIGFLPEDALTFGESPADDSSGEAAAPAKAGGKPGARGAKPAKDDAEDSAADELLAPKSSVREPRLPGQVQPVVSVRVLGGMAFFTVTDVNSLLNTNDFKTGYYYGGEVLFTLSKKVFLVGRVERIFKTFSAMDTGTKKSFQFDLASQPLMIGLEYKADPSPNLFWSFSALGGLGLNTSLKATYSVDGSATVLSEHAWTALGKTTFGLKLLSGRMTVFAEAGYRLLSTSAITPTTVGTHSQVFKTSATGSYVPVKIDLGGSVAGIGVGVAF